MNMKIYNFVELLLFKNAVQEQGSAYCNEFGVRITVGPRTGRVLS